MRKLFSKLLRKLPRVIREPITEHNALRYDRRTYSAEAKKRIAAMGRDDAEALFRAWYGDFQKYYVSFTEYWDQYRFPERSEEEKAAYMSAGAMRKVYRQGVDPQSRRRFWNKDSFLTEYSEYVHRAWMHANASTSVEELREFLSRFDVIVKPLNGTHGQGIRKLSKGAEPVAEGLVGHDLMIEQCVTGEATMQAFHPQSLNTLRVAMFTDGKSEVRTMWAVLRTGNRNCCIDNTHGGGVSSLIDVKTGTVISDGQCNGEIYANHPASGIAFRGFRIPCWDEVVRICTEAALKYPQTYFVGWDVAVWDDGRVELIEGNHGPDVDGVQTLLGRGIMPQITEAMRELNIGRGGRRS